MLQKLAALKRLESRFDVLHDPRADICIRLDGCRFARYTSAFNKPFDLAITNAMRQTCRDLMAYFDAKYAYTISDEITLLIPSPRADGLSGQAEIKNGLKTHKYNGRSQKLASVSASYCAVRFNHHIRSLKIDTQEGEYAIFDARTISIDKESDVSFVDILTWRQLMDGRRNIVGEVGRCFLGDVKGMRSKQVEEELLKSHSVVVHSDSNAEWHEVYDDPAKNSSCVWMAKNSSCVWIEEGNMRMLEPSIAWGSFMSKRPVLVDCFDPKLNSMRTVQRQRIMAYSGDISLLEI
eukprot:Partr_v1_DN28464_c2_g1_i2_m41161 putative tRNAHis guanylyltransferase